MPTKKEIEKTIANFGDRKSDGVWKKFVADNAEAEKKDAHLKKLIKHGVENSSMPVSKAAQGSKQHKMDVITYIDKMNEIYGNGKESSVPKVADQKIFAENINKKPFYPSRATPRQVGDLAEKMEKQRQMTGEMSTWDIMKATAKTPAEKKEIRDVIRDDYNKHGAKHMAEDDLRWIGKGKISPPVKIDVAGISESINNYINLTRPIQPVEIKRPPKKQRDPDLELGIAQLIGGSHDL